MKRTPSTDNQADIAARFALAGRNDPTIAEVLGCSVGRVRALRKEYEIAPGETRWLGRDNPTTPASPTTEESPKMAKAKRIVTLLKTVSFTIEVEADSDAAALEKAHDAAPNICAQCTGWGKNWEVNDDNEWETIKDFLGDRYDPERDGPEVELAD